jgi:hypothetical protein
MVYMSMGKLLGEGENAPAQNPMKLRRQAWIRVRDDGNATAGQPVREPSRLQAEDLHARPTATSSGWR